MSALSDDQVIYLDDNGSNPIDPRVIAAMSEVFTSTIGNASSAHVVGQRSRIRVETAREQVAALVGAAPSGVVFTGGATEANNLLLRGLPLPEGAHIVISAGEHASVTRVAEHLASTGRVRLTVATLTAQGAVDLDEVDSALCGGDVELVSVVAANSETGVMNPIVALEALVHGRGALLHCDATQWLGRSPWPFQDLGVDAVSISAHKMAGPQGVGALVASRGLLRSLTPQALGGGHEDGVRSGSHNVAGIVGFGVATSFAADPRVAVRVAALRDSFEAELCSAGYVRVNGRGADRLPNTTNVHIEGAPGDVLLARCPSIAASLGSACRAGALEPSPTLLSMGLDRHAASESVRFSLPSGVDSADVARAAATVLEAVRDIRELQEWRPDHAPR